MNRPINFPFHAINEVVGFIFLCINIYIKKVLFFNYKTN